MAERISSAAWRRSTAVSGGSCASTASEPAGARAQRCGATSTAARPRGRRARAAPSVHRRDLSPPQQQPARERPGVSALRRAPPQSDAPKLARAARCGSRRLGRSTMRHTRGQEPPVRRQPLCTVRGANHRSTASGLLLRDRRACSHSSTHGCMRPSTQHLRRTSARTPTRITTCARAACIWWPQACIRQQLKAMKRTRAACAAGLAAPWRRHCRRRSGTRTTAL